MGLPVLRTLISFPKISNQKGAPIATATPVISQPKITCQPFCSFICSPLNHPFLSQPIGKG